MLNKQTLLTHIEKRNNGYLNFSDIELNNAYDLIMFHNFTIDQVCKMSDHEIEEILENDGQIEVKIYKNDYNIVCKKCGKPVNMEYTDNPEDGYLLECKCGHTGFMSIYCFEN